MNKMTTVDSHLHLNQNGVSASNVIKYLDKEKIDYCWLLTWEEINPGVWEYHHLAIEDVYETYLKHHSRILPFYAPDPHKEDAANQLENWCLKGIRGCGELKTTLNWNSDGVKLILQSARKLKIPIVFHMEKSEYRSIPYSNALYDKIIYYGLRTERKVYQIPRKVIQIVVSSFTPLRNRTKSYIFPGYMLDFASLETTLREYPDVNFIAHGPMFWQHMSKNFGTENESFPKDSIVAEGIIWRLLKDYSNLYADISGPTALKTFKRDTKNTKNFLSCFGDKLLYGTDNQLIEHREFVNSLGLSKGTYKKLYGENACRIVPI